MRSSLSIYYFLLITVVFFSCSEKSSDTSLPRSTPEEEGVSSDAILQFIDAVEKSKNEPHSFMFVRHGKVIAEGWWKPYRSDLKHTMYSTSKSFTSTAAGFAVSEGKLSAEDKVISFFPDQLPDTISTFLQELRVKDLLSMSVGQEPDPTLTVVTRDSNWVKSFFKTPIVKKPGTEFLYNTLATYMVSSIVQKVTGERVMDYLKPRLFDPLAIEGMDWEVDPNGVNVGGWGLRVKTEDMAKLGQLYLQNGNWNGKQLLPQSWIEEATTAVIKDSAPYLPLEKKDSSDWAQGYGYQFWRCRNNAFRADGAYGQYIIVMPQQDAVIAITSETPDMQDELNLVWKYLLPAMQQNKMEVSQATTQLKEKLNSLALPIKDKSKSAMESKIVGKTFSFQTNDGNYEEVSFQFTENHCVMNLKMKGQSYPIQFESGAWHFGDTKILGPTLIPAKAHFAGLPDPQVAGSYYWLDENTLELTLRYIESPHTVRYICRFNNESVNIEIMNSNGFGSVAATLIGSTNN